jgi:hypothetical protein
MSTVETATEIRPFHAEIPQGEIDLPSWAVVSTGDKAAGTDLTRSMAERAEAAITEFEGSH